MVSNKKLIIDVLTIKVLIKLKSKVVVSVIGDKNTKKIPGSDKVNIIIETLIKLLNSNLIK